MYCVVAVAGNGEELWVYGSYVDKIAASDFAEKMAARYPEIEYVVAELLDPGQAGRRSDDYFSHRNEETKLKGATKGEASSACR